MVWLSRARRGAGLVAAVTLVIVVTTGALLTWRYLPSGGGPDYLLPPGVRWSQRLVRWHEASMAAAVPAMLLWAGATASDRTPWSRRKGIGVGSGIVGALLIGLTARGWQLVRWQQLGLWAVTVGNNVRGLWYAAFSDQVRFALVDGRGEVSKADMAPWVIVHLLAPLIALAVVAVGWLAGEAPVAARRSSGSRRDDAVESD